MRKVRKCDKKESMFGRSEGEVRARLVSCRLFLVSLNYSIRECMLMGGFLLTSYMRAGLRIEHRPPPRQD